MLLYPRVAREEGICEEKPPWYPQVASGEGIGEEKPSPYPQVASGEGIGEEKPPLYPQAAGVIKENIKFAFWTSSRRCKLVQ